MSLDVFTDPKIGVIAVLISVTMLLNSVVTLATSIVNNRSARAKAQAETTQPSETTQISKSSSFSARFDRVRLFIGACFSLLVLPFALWALHSLTYSGAPLTTQTAGNLLLFTSLLLISFLKTW